MIHNAANSSDYTADFYYLYNQINCCTYKPRISQGGQGHCHMRSSTIKVLQHSESTDCPSLVLRSILLELQTYKRMTHMNTKRNIARFQLIILNNQLAFYFFSPFLLLHLPTRVLALHGSHCSTKQGSLTPLSAM